MDLFYIIVIRVKQFEFEVAEKFGDGDIYFRICKTVLRSASFLEEYRKGLKFRFDIGHGEEELTVFQDKNENLARKVGGISLTFSVPKMRPTIFQGGRFLEMGI